MEARPGYIFSTRTDSRLPQPAPRVAGACPQALLRSTAAAFALRLLWKGRSARQQKPAAAGVEDSPGEHGEQQPGAKAHQRRSISPSASPRFKPSRILEPQPRTQTSFSEQPMGSIFPSSKAGSQELVNAGKAGAACHAIPKRRSVPLQELLEDTENVHSNDGWFNDGWVCSDSAEAMSFVLGGTLRAAAAASRSSLSA